jgi:alkylation response protein AidB-like acyl-CoA dehydrogenase
LTRDNGDGRHEHCSRLGHYETDFALLKTNAAKRLFSDVRALAPEVTARANEIETARRIPLDLVEKLRTIGVFRMFVPNTHGGLELDLASGLGIIKEIARIDSSLGWTAMIGNGSAVFAALLQPKVYEQMYQNGPDVILGGSTQPAGTAEKVADGWRVSGRWPFASGCQHADWLLAVCVMTLNGKPLPEPDGENRPPMMRCFFLPACDWTIEDTWYAAGLRGPEAITSQSGTRLSQRRCFSSWLPASPVYRDRCTGHPGKRFLCSLAPSLRASPRPR